MYIPIISEVGESVQDVASTFVVPHQPSPIEKPTVNGATFGLGLIALVAAAVIHSYTREN